MSGYPLGKNILPTNNSNQNNASDSETITSSVDRVMAFDFGSFDRVREYYEISDSVDEYTVSSSIEDDSSLASDSEVEFSYPYAMHEGSWHGVEVIFERDIDPMFDDDGSTVNSDPTFNDDNYYYSDDDSSEDSIRSRPDLIETDSNGIHPRYNLMRRVVSENFYAPNIQNFDNELHESLNYWRVLNHASEYFGSYDFPSSAVTDDWSHAGIWTMRDIRASYDLQFLFQEYFYVVLTELKMLKRERKVYYPEHDDNFDNLMRELLVVVSISKTQFLSEGNDIEGVSLNPKDYAKSKYQDKPKEDFTILKTLRKLNKKKDKKEKKNRQTGNKGRKSLVSEGLFETCGGLKEDLQELVRNRFEVELGDRVKKSIHVVEDVMLLVFSLKDQKTWKGVIATTLLYLKSKVKDRSLITELMQFIFGISLATTSTALADLDEAFGEFPNFDDDVLISESLEDVSEFIETLKGFGQGFATFNKCGAFQRIQKVISVMLALGMFGEREDFTMTLKGITFFHIGAINKTMHAGDMVELVLETLVYFLERGYKCFEAGSIQPLFYESDEVLAFERDYAKLVSNLNFIKIGDFKNSPWIDELDFELMLSNLTQFCQRLHASVPKNERPMVLRRLEILQKARADFQMTRTQGGLREAPFAFLIHGSSGVGKSSISSTLTSFALLTQAAQKGNTGYVIDPKTICTMNDMDKYHSDYHCHTVAVNLDDLANANEKTTTANPAVNVIDLINNVRKTAVKADVHEKGVVPLQPRVVAATTNIWKTWAHYYSKEPLSILRRFQMHICATVKPEFRQEGSTMLDSAKMRAATTNGVVVPDAWNFDVYEFKGVDGDQRDKGKAQPTNETFVMMEKDGIMVPAQQISMPELLELFRSKILSHGKNQESVVASTEKIYAQTLCPHNTFASYCTSCNPHLHRCGQLHSESVIDDFSFKVRELNQLRYIPDWLARSTSETFFSTLKKCTTLRFLLENIKDIKHACYFLAVSSVLVVATTFLGNFRLASFLSCATIFFLMLVSLQRKCELQRALSLSENYYLDLYKRMANRDKTKGAKIFCTVSGLVVILAIWKKMRGEKKTKESCALPGKYITGGGKCSEFVSEKQFDYVSHGNRISFHQEETGNFMTPEVQPLPKNLSDSISVADIADSMSKQLMIATVENREGVCQTSDAVFVQSCVLLVPYHMVNGAVKISVKGRPEDVLTGRNFTSEITEFDIVRLHSDSDLALVYLPSSGPMKNLMKFFPEEVCQKLITMNLYHRNNDCELEVRLARASHYGSVEADRGEFLHGLYYQMGDASFKGLCAAPLVHKMDKKSFIVGFHLAGAQRERGINAAEMVTKDMLQHAIETLAKDRCAVLPLESGELRTKLYGIDFTPTEAISAKSPLSRLSNSEQITVFGKNRNFAIRPKSRVIPSVLSTIVEEVFEVPQQHGPPANCRKDETKVPVYQPYQEYCQGSGKASQTFPTEVLHRATEDYKRQIDRILETEEGKSHLAEVRVLDNVEATSGLDGVKFIDPLKKNTSMGFPVNKPKSDYLCPTDPHEGITEPMIVDDETLKIANEWLDCYKEGKNVYPVFKACTKDEPTKLTKQKVRVFQAAPIALQLIVRKYCLTICRFLSMAPLKTECAVGVNPQGPGWHDLNQYILAYGVDRIVAGDFKKFDQHMAAQMILKAFSIFEYIGIKAGYSDEDLRVMRGIVTELAYPVVNLNGELVQFFGSNPSGQNLTVYINSIVNSLYHRCVFFTIYPEMEESFDDAVRMTTYGDDVKMSVSERYPKYNHTEIQAVFAKQGIEYTMAEKEAASVPYINHSEADFLKRQTRLDPKYSFEGSDGMWIGNLCDESIFKSLHSNLKSSTESPTSVAISCLEGAAREWFFAGEEIFAEKHSKLCEVARKADLEGVMPDSFYHKFSEREQEWMEKYGITYN